jgi:hypothetical protein
VIDGLEADHRRVSDNLGAVEAAADALAENDGHAARSAAADALHRLCLRPSRARGGPGANLEATVLGLRDYDHD